MSYIYLGKNKITPFIGFGSGGERYNIINIEETTSNITLDTYTIYEANILDILNIFIPNVIKGDFIAQINFISGATPTIVNAENIEFFGDNVSETSGFKPRANCSYSIIFYYTEETMRGVIQGSSL